MYKFLATAAISLSSGLATAVPSAPAKVEAFFEGIGVDASQVAECQLCHVSRRPLFNRQRNPFGLQVQQVTNVKNPSIDLTEILELDADDDGYSNLEEIEAGSFPGNPDETPL